MGCCPGKPEVPGQPGTVIVSLGDVDVTVTPSKMQTNDDSGSGSAGGRYAPDPTTLPRRFSRRFSVQNRARNALTGRVCLDTCLKVVCAETCGWKVGYA